MTNCYRCNRDLELGSHDEQEHDVCYKEWQRRINARSCIMCDKNPSTSDNRCVECANSETYRDYPGP